ncbi:CreA family protein [Phreatobacter sp.]|uniref:CreA family protein n=1 Tax=Phreatobacter sp. TaxID=1966341 RepID=UPI003F6F97E9
MRPLLAAVLALAVGVPALPSYAQSPELIFRRSTVFRLLSPNDKLATYGIDDPEVEGVACHFTVPEKGGWAGAFGFAEQLSEVSLACRQIGPIRFKSRSSQGDVVFREGRSFFFKRVQIVRGCDARRNVLVYMIYSDKLIDGSPQNSTSTVPIMPWGQQAEIARCGDFIS